MNLREYLLEIGQHYSMANGFDTQPQKLLSNAKNELSQYAPADFVIKASGGQRPLNTTETPWIGFFDPDESSSPQEGLYVVWLLRADQSAWTLSVNMGTERLSRTLKDQDEETGNTSAREPRVRAKLRAEASAIRASMDAKSLEPWDTSIDLKSKSRRQLRYEAATIAAHTYDLASFPSEQQLREDLTNICQLLEEAILAKRAVAIVDPGSITTASATTGTPDGREYSFAPFADKESKVRPPRRPIKRTPRHQSGLTRYGHWLIARGFQPASNVHPRDFILVGTPEWIGEYKVVYGKDVARATREAHSQLKEYRHFLYPAQQQVPLLAVFSAPVTEARVAWLNAEGIAVVWDDGTTWRGCPLAQAAGLGT
ncbi:MrcB family domain-containing protein [Geodermatophilus sp. SYSU D01119]